jgi:hypothetical protein
MVSTFWLVASAAIAGDTVSTAFPPPDGYARVAGDPFGASLGALGLLPAEAPVQTHDGRAVAGHRARVVALPLVPGDLQQCADSAIRLRAEWLRSQGSPVVFHATSGDPLPYSRWAAGERPFERGGRIAWQPGTAGGWERYLAAVFMWAGTRSLAYDTVAAEAPLPGDLLVAPGSPGHAVVLLDVARAGSGEVAVLVGEGFMPAQSFHVEIGPLAGWWPYEDGVDLPHWTLPGSGLRRWAR